MGIGRPECMLNSKMSKVFIQRRARMSGHRSANLACLGDVCFLNMQCRFVRHMYCTYVYIHTCFSNMRH